MESKRALKQRLIELDASGFPTRVHDALLDEINKRASKALDVIVKEVVTTHALASLFANGDLTTSVKVRKQRKQVIQEGCAPFGQYVPEREPGTVTGSESNP